jgi:hypothetical protein
MNVWFIVKQLIVREAPVGLKPCLIPYKPLRGWTALARRASVKSARGFNPEETPTDNGFPHRVTHRAARRAEALPQSIQAPSGLNRFSPQGFHEISEGFQPRRNFAGAGAGMTWWCIFNLVNKYSRHEN